MRPSNNCWAELQRYFSWGVVNMKIKTISVFLFAILFSISAFAEDRCTDCRQAALREWQKCMASAKTNSDMTDCKVQGQKLQEACDNGEGICKVTFSDQDKKDMALVVDFVKNNMDVIREVGNFQHAKWNGSYKSPEEPRPSRYIVYVFGGTKSAYVAVDVSRLSGETKPTIACITNISPSTFKGPLKDICKQ